MPSLAAPITDHVFRTSSQATRQYGRQFSDKVDPDRCCYLTTCNRPQDEHITRPDFHNRRAS
jgi:hypothetical protein